MLREQNPRYFFWFFKHFTQNFEFLGISAHISHHRSGSISELCILLWEDFFRISKFLETHSQFAKRQEGVPQVLFWIPSLHPCCYKVGFLGPPIFRGADCVWVSFNTSTRFRTQDPWDMSPIPQPLSHLNQTKVLIEGSSNHNRGRKAIGLIL